MTPESFCYWLQGFVELTNSDKDAVLDAPEWKMIKEHLKEVLHKVTPPFQNPQYNPLEMQKGIHPHIPNYQQGQAIC